MNRLTASLLAIGLAASVGTASAQSQGTYSQYGQPTASYGQAGGYYDYARVVRVDPVIDSGYRNTSYSNQQRCYTRQDTYAGNDGYYNGSNGSYGDPYYPNGYGNQGYPNQGYGTQGYGSTTGRNVATIIGGVLGAAIGSQVGGGSARYATSAIGSMVGGMAGRQVYENAHRTPPRTGTVQVCDPVPVNGNGYYSSNTGNYGSSGVSAYDVTYEYGGHTYTTRTNYHPGDRIRVRVDVHAE